MTQLSDEVVERVARALAVADGKDPDEPAWARFGARGMETGGICWRDQYSAQARAAIAAYEAKGDIPLV